MPRRLSLSELESLATQAGYRSYHDMLYELYHVHQKNLVELSRLCKMSPERLRRHMARFGIKMRSKGGPNNVKVVMTPELVQEIALNGIPATAQRLGIDPVRLSVKLKEYCGPADTNS